MNIDVVKRNFLRLICSGAFNEPISLEPMSVFKWKKLLLMAVVQNVESIVADGIGNYGNDENTDIPIKNEFMYAASRSEKSGLPVRGQDRQLTNPILRRRLNHIRENERHAIDTSVETLELLNLIIYNTNNILTYGISFKGIIALGKYLREKGNLVDFIKLDAWLEKLKMQEIARLEGSILISTLNFEMDEVPFVRKIDYTAHTMAIESLSKMPTDGGEKWHFKEGPGGIVYNNTEVLRKNVWHCLKYISYAPIEAVSNFFYNLTRSLSEIEE